MCLSTYIHTHTSFSPGICSVSRYTVTHTYLSPGSCSVSQYTVTHTPFSPHTFTCKCSLQFLSIWFEASGFCYATNTRPSPGLLLDTPALTLPCGNPGLTVLLISAPLKPLLPSDGMIELISSAGEANSKHSPVSTQNVDYCFKPGGYTWARISFRSLRGRKPLFSGFVLGFACRAISLNWVQGN